MKFGRAGYDSKALSDYLAPAVIIGSVYFFLFFTKLSFHSRMVNWIATSAFAVYLFHCDPLFFRRYYLLPIKDFYLQDSLPLFILHTGALIISVFFVSILVDKLRAFLWNRSVFIYKQIGRKAKRSYLTLVIRSYSTTSNRIVYFDRKRKLWRI